MRRLTNVFREAAHGLRRNFTMTIAVILTVAVSLTLLGTGVLVGKQVQAMKGYWYDKIEVTVVLCGTGSDPKTCPSGPATVAERTAVQTALQGLKPTVETVYYESKQEAFEHFQQDFKGSPITQNVTVDAMPESFRVKLVNPEDYQIVANKVSGMPGVEQVEDQRNLLGKFFSLLDGLRNIALGVAIAMLVVTVLLVLNTMRVSAYARRRETAIMKLVGASNMYIRAPFVLEAAISAAIGGLIAVGAMAAVKVGLLDRVISRFGATVTWDEVVTAMIGVFIVGVLLACISAWFAVRRFLKV